MENQIILIDKPAGISSFGVVAKIRRQLRDEFGHKVKVGHTGTLDPFATGLLILLSGQYTKKSGEFLKLDKIYEATMKLGYTSTTGDPEGEITKYSPVQAGGGAGETPTARSRQTRAVEESATTGPANSSMTSREYYLRSEKTLSEILDSFIGTITQTPPKFSAIKVGGQRAYKLARKGQDFELPSRTIEIYSIEILSYNYPLLKIRVHCSSGTYIRTLAEDIGKTLSTGAYLTALRRTHIGKYSVENARKLVI